MANAPLNGEVLAPSDQFAKLTAEESVMVERIIEGSTYSDAYRDAYGVAHWKRAALHVAASRKVAEPKIQYAIAQVRALGLAKLAISHAVVLEQRLAEEYAFHAECRAAGDRGPAGLAFDRINRLLGLYSDRPVPELGLHDPEHTLRQIAAVSPELASALAVQHNIPWQVGEKPKSEARH